MKIEKIQDFLASRHEFLVKWQTILDTLYDLDAVNYETEQKLNETIDNGLDKELLEYVAEEYKKHGLLSPVVKEFVEKIDSMFLSGVDSRLKANLDVVGISIKLTSLSLYDMPFENTSSSTSISSPISISFSDVAADKSFDLLIPVKGSCRANMADWLQTGSGMYKVLASVHDIDIEICKAFDQSLVARAVEQYLLDSSKFIKNDKQPIVYNSYEVASLESKFSKYFLDIERLGMNGLRDGFGSQAADGEGAAAGYITDICRFKAEKIQA